MKMIRVLIADDQSLFLESLSTFLRNYAEDIDVVGTAKNGAEALARAEELEPDIVLMEVHMPVLDGVEATRRIMEARPGIKIIILSTYDEDEYVRKALGFGASGYLLKDISPTELIASIRALDSGAVQISPQIVAKLMQSRTKTFADMAAMANENYEGRLGQVEKCREIIAQRAASLWEELVERESAARCPQAGE